MTAGCAWQALRSDRRGATALEAAVVLPLAASMIVMLVSLYDVMSSQRAVEYGLERALRYVAVQSATATSATITDRFMTSARALSPQITTANSSVAVSPASGFTPGQTVSIAVTYTWQPTAYTPGFLAIPMNRTASVTVVH